VNIMARVAETKLRAKKALNILRTDLERDMTLVGCRNVNEIDNRVIRDVPVWPVSRR